MKRHWPLRFLLAAAVLFAVEISFATDATNRPASWAVPQTLAGVPNFYQVATNLYRGAQPTSEGMEHLRALGIKYVVNLRMLRSDQPLLRHAGLKGVNLAMVPWHVNSRDVLQFLKAVTDTNNLPVFVHCERGADRTGLMCAMYRVVVCNWTKAEALSEMKDGGFHFSPAWKSLISFVEKADVAWYRQKLGWLDLPGAASPKT